MYKLFLAFRYLQSRKIVFFAVMGLAVGVMVLIVVTSVMSGFAVDLRDRIRGTSSHLTVSADPGQFILEPAELLKSVRAIPHVTAVSPRLEWLVIRGRGTGYAYMIGIDPAIETQVGDLRKYMLDGREPSFELPPEFGSRPGAIIGSTLFGWYGPGLAAFGEEGTELTMTTIRPDGGNLKPRQTSFTIVGRFESGFDEVDSATVYVPLAAAQKFLGVEKEGGITTLAIAIDDYERAAEVKQAVRDAVRPYGFFEVQTWEDQKRGLVNAVYQEQGLVVLLLFFISLVAGFMVLALLSMMVREKTRDIGILRSLGAGRAGIVGLFLAQGAIIGAFGAGMGLFLGALLVNNLNPIADHIYRLTGWHPFPPKIYFLSRIPTLYDPETMCLIGLAGFLTSVFFSIPPALRAARLDPVEALRYE